MCCTWRIIKLIIIYYNNYYYYYYCNNGASESARAINSDDRRQGARAREDLLQCNDTSWVPRLPDYDYFTLHRQLVSALVAVRLYRVVRLFVFVTYITQNIIPIVLNTEIHSYIIYTSSSSSG